MDLSCFCLDSHCLEYETAIAFLIPVWKLISMMLLMLEPCLNMSNSLHREQFLRCC